MDYITVKLFRVSQESVYLDIIAECLSGYIFNKIEVGVRTYDHYGNALTENNYSLTDSVLSDYNTDQLSIRIPLSAFFGEGGILPAIYNLILGCIEPSGIVRELKFSEPEYYIGVIGLRTSPTPVLVNTNLLIHNVEELYKLESGTIGLNGAFSMSNLSGTLGVSSFPYRVGYDISGSLGISGSTGIVGPYGGEVSINNSNLILDVYSDSISGAIGLPDTYENQRMYLSSGALLDVFKYSGGIGMVTPSTLVNSDGEICYSSDSNYCTLLSSGGLGFNPGDIINATMKYLYSYGSGHVGLSILLLTGAERVIYSELSVLVGLQIPILHTLTESDILLDGSIILVMENYRTTKFSSFTISRSIPPSCPPITVSGELFIEKTYKPDYLEVSVYTSDTNSAFYYLIDNILNLENSCTPISDDAIRNYLILYGHLLALENGLQSIAEEYFKILVKNFTKCGNNSRACGGPCGCQSSPCGSNQHHQHPTHNSCNCNS